MIRRLILPMVLLSACIGSLSPDRSPTGVDLPESPPPLPPAPPPPGPPVAIAEVKAYDLGTAKVGAQLQISLIAKDANGKVVSLASEHPTYTSFNSRVATVSSTGLVTTMSVGDADILVVVREIRAWTKVQVTN